tara:strand:+ start:931 stop:1533 length:603 start_codon:yes stop_codon:yes gene_type:complete
MKRIIITQRFEKIGKHRELRDSLDVRLSNLIEKLGYSSIPLPNNLKKINKFIYQVSPDGIILSGGGDPLKKDKRHKNELKLIKYSIQKKIPLIGICRGAQVLNIYFGGKITKIRNHVRKTHRIFGPLISKKKNILVNSFHDYGFKQNLLGKNLKILARSSDKVVESFCHNKHNLLGIMWHPERYKNLKKFDINLIRKVFN